MFVRVDDVLLLMPPHLTFELSLVPNCNESRHSPEPLSLAAAAVVVDDAT